MNASEILKLYNPETFASLILFIGFIGFGFFFYKRFWPWYVDHKQKQYQCDFDLEMKRLGVEADSDKRWQETTARQIDAFAKFTAEIAVLNTRIGAVIEGINRLYRVIGNGKDTLNS